MAARDAVATAFATRSAGAAQDRLLQPMSQHVLLFCQFLTATVFAVSAGGKLRDVTAFAESLRSFEVPRMARFAVARMVILIEICVVLLVLWPPSSVIGFSLAAVLLVCLSIAVHRVVSMGLKVSCRCFGRERSTLTIAHVWRNMALVCAAGAGILAASGSRSEVRLPAAEIILVLVVAGATLLLVLLVDRLEPLVGGASRKGTVRTPPGRMGR